MWSTGKPWCFLPSFKSVGLLVQKKKHKIEFQDCGHRFTIGMVYAIFDLQVTMFPTKFQVNWPFSSGGEMEKKKKKKKRKKKKRKKKRFSRWPPWQPFWISNRNNFSQFYLPFTMMLPTKFWVNWPLRSREEAKNRLIFKISAILDFWSQWF